MTRSTKPAAPLRKTAKPKGKAAAPAVALDGIDTPSIDLMGLTPREARFVDSYLATFNASAAYLEAGYQCKPSVAGSLGSRMLKNAKVAPFVAARIKAMLEGSAQHQATLMQALMYAAFADVRELVEYHRGSCRHCWGKFNRYEYSAGEWDAIMTKHATKQELAEEKGTPAPKEPDPKGGTGYHWGREANPECPECAGWGEGKVIVHDTRHLSPAAVALYAGVKEGKDGIEVKLQDKMRALDTLVKIAKLYDDTKTVNVSVTAAELQVIYAEKMTQARDRMAAMREERRQLRAQEGR